MKFANNVGGKAIMVNAACHKLHNTLDYVKKIAGLYLRGILMRFAILSKTFRFEAAHSLPDHRGKCARLHGHSYKLEVMLRVPIKDLPGQSEHGMVMDFEDLSRVVRSSIIEQLDHHNLNEVTNIQTTAENLAHWMWDVLVSAGLPESLLYRLRLWETDSSCVEITQVERTGESSRKEFVLQQISEQVI